MNTNTQPLVITEREAAKMLSISRSQLAKMRYRGEIQGVLFGQKCVRYAIEDLQALIARGACESTRQAGYEFRLILKPIDMTEELANRLHETGGTPGTFCGVPFVHFHREAENLESAIRSAVTDVRKAGCVVDCAQIDFSGGK